MRSLTPVTSSTTLCVQSVPQRWLAGLLGRPQGGPKFAVRIPDLELRRSGHVSAGGSEVVLIREEFRAIKKHLTGNLASAIGDRDPRVILVTSARPGEGKTFVALNVALSLALDREMHVTLVDGDVVSAGLTQRFNLGGAEGLLDALHTGSDGGGRFGQDSNVGNFTIVPVGRLRSDAVELLSGPRMDRFLNTLVGSSGMVVVDSASVLSGSSAAALARHAGQVVFVIECDETGRSTVDEGLTMLDADIGPLESANVGLVLNKINRAKSAARYYARSS